MTNKIVDGWILAWALAYLICAIVKPDIYIGRSAVFGATVMLSMFILLTSCVLSARLGYHQISIVLCLVTGFMQAFATVGAYTGIIKYYGPIGYSEASQLFMAVADFISAVCLITKGLSLIDKQKKQEQRFICG